MCSAVKNILDKLLVSICGLAIFILVTSVSWQVFSRYVLNDPSSFTDELSRYVMIWLGLFGASYLFGKNGHLAITLLIDSVNEQWKKYLQLLINMICLAFTYLAMFKGGLLLMGRTMQQFSPVLNIPMSYVYAILPISGSIMMIYILINCIQMLHNNNERS
ncbi:C4-dicarboxylate ABC transporter permease [Photobacterium gaetbulicola]|uniref:TRAP transporter small permease protein n=1 Tax=Photobacterium gaetbulicola TaxID=1295392 RepID=A0A0B9GXE4_9GAMM|nr:C4-dicarboxylate ABC transporter permease [Photobacterium gaetbulicola]